MEKVLTSRREKIHPGLYYKADDYCSISDSMASYMAGLFGVADKKVPNRLESKEAFLNDVSATVRKDREDAVAKAIADGKPMTAEEAIKWHNAEAKKRLEANKLRMKLRQGQSR